MPADATCPKCHARIDRGALRCRHCGADARGAEPAGMHVSVPVGEVFEPGSERARCLEILQEIERRDPQLAEWMASDKKTRGPQPLTTGDVAELLEEARRLLGI